VTAASTAAATAMLQQEREGKRRGRSQRKLYTYSSLIESLVQNWAIEKEGGHWSDRMI
jgi:hypothetical protein